VPAIENFPRLGNMGVVLTACTTCIAVTAASAIVRRSTSSRPMPN
jgi:hypothetical protein